MVRYRVKPEYAVRNEELVRRVFDELQLMAPQGIRYATLVLDDGASFVHLASLANDDDRNPLMDVAAFRAFQEGIGERCDEPPRVVNLREVGSYGLFRSANAAGETVASR